MSTNFYFNYKEEEVLKLDDFDNPKYHIGIRNVAGLYCFNCNRTLCKDGEGQIHQGKGKWFSCCPICNRDKGVDVISLANSFTWGNTFYNTFIRLKTDKSLKGKPVIDEYGEEYTMRDFKLLLVKCPIQFFNMIGISFS